MVTRWSRSTSNFYALIGQNLTGEFMRKIYAASWILFTLTAEADRVLCQLVMFLTVFFHWMYKMKYSCYQESSVIHGVAWPQQCWKSCANRSNIVALRFGDQRTKKMLGVVGWKVWSVSNFAQQHATTSNNMQQGVETDATCNIQHVASVCTGL